ncbi:hypothetical protein [Roseovarius aquimarinus]|uniref:Uncharacterized protein n=1 Tax=Roseovarius aquimarinus TaxID=1229156 RepID=A0ABW7I7D0_9RHOB
MIAAALALSPGAALAGACDLMRPGWDGAPVTIWAETLALFASPAALALLVGSALAVAFRSPWAALVLCVLWSGLTMLVAVADPGGLRAEALAEGCRASPALFIVIVAAICGAMILRTGRPAPERDETP